ncbi:transcriptional regulator with XRE-family HTH domain [Bacillus mesophilus]|uniref:Helix-turn-helix transcriptional regulator n=1 Tax=Bacillus mesophilus TaxID=1808955 RepID=A0A6M0QBG7_9BACI|nr:helix-turn-helix domain-containing protein [Bacillus mesophilus]MBM7662515.1 transcriptional regulator with XRE-family HTH domain [Bacillus mesophilus]NEY72860.1 helix-turn-helix transcriptional regulator [Bacillus mesophilus]
MAFKPDFNKIGPAIKDLRKLKGLTQKALCDNGDIISQAQLSRIENGYTYGLWDKIFLIAERLGIDVNYFFEIAKNTDSEFVLGVKNNVRELVEKREYQIVFKMIKIHKKNPSFYNNKQNLQFLIWHEGICTFHLTKDFNLSHDLFQQALDLTYTPPKYITEQELSIKNSIGVISFETGNYDLAISTYKSALKEIRHAPVPIKKKVKIRLLYNLAKALSTTGDYNESINSCSEGISICKQNTYYYLLGELYYQLAFNHFFKEQFLVAKENTQKAIQVFIVNDDEESLIRAKAALKEIEDKLKG